MMRILRLFGLAIVASALWLAYCAVAPEAPDYTPTHTELARRAARESVAWFRALDLAPEKTFFGTLGHDDFGFVSEPIRRGIRQLDKVELAQRGFCERCRQCVGWTVPTYADSAALLAAAKPLGCRYAVGGRVVRFSQWEDRVELELEIAVWDVQGQCQVGQKQIQLQSQDAPKQRVSQEPTPAPKGQVL